MTKKNVLILALTLCLFLVACSTPDDAPETENISTSAPAADTVAESAKETETETETEAETVPVPADFVPFASEGVVFETEEAWFSYTVVQTELKRGGRNVLEITVKRKEDSEPYVYEGCTTFSEPYIYVEHIDENGNRTDVTDVLVTEDEITREYLPGEVIEKRTSFYIPMDAPSGIYGITIAQVSAGSVWIEDVFYLE